MVRDMLVLGAAVLAVVYLVNPTAGVIEFIPDNFPLIGNMDEVGATAILVGAMRYHGIDPLRLFDRSKTPLLPPEAGRDAQQPGK